MPAARRASALTSRPQLRNCVDSSGIFRGPCHARAPIKIKWWRTWPGEIYGEGTSTRTSVDGVLSVPFELTARVM
jgi:hypothetical protein